MLITYSPLFCDKCSDVCMQISKNKFSSYNFNYNVGDEGEGEKVDFE